MKDSDKNKLVDTSGGFIQTFNNFLWTDLSGIITAVLWKLQKIKIDEKMTYPDRNGNVAVVTSGFKNSEVFLIKELAERGFKVVVGAKDPSKCERLQDMIKTNKFSNSIDILELDLGSFKSIKNFADDVINIYPNVYLLVNNFTEFFPKYNLTEDGLESNIAANYFGPFYLTHLLINKMKYTAFRRLFFSRVVNVVTPDFLGLEMNYNDINNVQNFKSDVAYRRAKLATIMMTKLLTHLIDSHHYPINLFAVNPGLLDTSWTSSLMKSPWTSWIFSKLQVKPSESANSVLNACLSKDFERHGGLYLSNGCQMWTSSSHSCNKEHQKYLFHLTLDLLRLKCFGTGNAVTDIERLKKGYYPSQVYI